ncbi:MAG: hypothetical protein EOO61_08030 [Hymenobacter sp.]|nr:MAG: hypothetical protein EOO61_08030 [Hymenobacter sp.]
MIAQQPPDSGSTPAHLEQLLTLPFELCLFGMLASVFGADFRSEELLPQLSKELSRVLQSQSLLKAVGMASHLKKLMTSFVCGSLLILAGFSA